MIVCAWQENQQFIWFCLVLPCSLERGCKIVQWLFSPALAEWKHFSAKAGVK